ncbi:hypothetical protein, partial [Sphingomonas sp. 3-13AW]|uniref:hypothetical protein n=1 Tax=Sphingomonas sp. 3-13AW TaxID=3050450 RepID=UPI003BB63F10
CRVLLLPILPNADWTERGPGTSYDAHVAGNVRTDALFPGLVARDEQGRKLTEFLQSRHDGSPEDLADIAAGFIPRSLRRPGDPLHLNAAGDLAVADFVDSALRAQRLPDPVTQTTDFTITAIGAGGQDTQIVRVGRGSVVTASELDRPSGGTVETDLAAVERKTAGLSPNALTKLSTADPALLNLIAAFVDEAGHFGAGLGADGAWTAKSLQA